MWFDLVTCSECDFKNVKPWKTSKLNSYKVKRLEEGSVRPTSYWMHKRYWYGIRVQDEKHVLLECPLTAHVRLQYQTLPLESLSSLMKCTNVIGLCNFVRDILRIYCWSQLFLKSIYKVLLPMVLTLVNNPKNLTIYTKRLPKKIYIKLKILNICYDSDRNICACLYTGSYYQCYATLLQNVFNLDTYLYILSCIFIVSIKITTTTTTAMPVPRRCIADGRVC